MKNEKIREFLTRLAQEEGFKDEFLKLKEKVEKNGFSKELNKQLISDHFLPWSKKLGYKLTKEDFIDFERTQKLPQITGLSLEQLENVSGGFGFPMLLSLFATFGSLIFGVGNGSTGNNTNANNDPVGTGLTSYSQTGAANQDYYDYAMSSVDDYDDNYRDLSLKEYEHNDEDKNLLSEAISFDAQQKNMYEKFITLKLTIESDPLFEHFAAGGYFRDDFSDVSNIIDSAKNANDLARAGARTDELSREFDYLKLFSATSKRFNELYKLLYKCPATSRSSFDSEYKNLRERVMSGLKHRDGSLSADEIEKELTTFENKIQSAIDGLK